MRKKGLISILGKAAGGFILAAFLLFNSGALALALSIPPADDSGILVLFDSPPGQSDRLNMERLGGQIKYNYNIVPGLAVTGISSRACAGLLRNPRVVDCAPDTKIFIESYESELAYTWGVERIGAGSAHAVGYSGQKVKVAVIDSGIDYLHPELSPELSLELSGAYRGGYDFVNNDDDPMDDNGHGTHVAGTIAALRDGNNVVGAAPEVELYALKVLGEDGGGNYSNVIKALEWSVEHKIQVTNNSYGSSGDPGALVKAAFDAAEAAGIVNVASAGNAGNVSGRGDNVGYPARYDSVIAVAATDKSDKRASFSSTGPAVELSAPGVAIISTYLNGTYASANGTSMAAPHVAGVAALLIAAGINDAREVRQTMNSTAVDLGNKGRDNLYGHGLVNVPAALATLPPPDNGEGVEDPEIPTEPEEPSGPDEPATPENPAEEPGQMAILIAFDINGGRNNDRHLSVTFDISVGDGLPVSGASLVFDLILNEQVYQSQGGLTGTDGTASFSFNNAPSGIYTVKVTTLNAEGLGWDDSTPDNFFEK